MDSITSADYLLKTFGRRLTIWIYGSFNGICPVRLKLWATEYTYISTSPQMLRICWGFRKNLVVPLPLQVSYLRFPSWSHLVKFPVLDSDSYCRWWYRISRIRETLHDIHDDPHHRWISSQFSRKHYCHTLHFLISRNLFLWRHLVDLISSPRYACQESRESWFPWPIPPNFLRSSATPRPNPHWSLQSLYIIQAELRMVSGISLKILH